MTFRPLFYIELRLPPASCLLPPASCLLPPASCLLPWPQANEQDLQEFYQPIEPEDEISTSDNLEDGAKLSITDWDLEEIA